jgi:hypothetical protein
LKAATDAKPNAIEFTRMAEARRRKTKLTAAAILATRYLSFAKIRNFSSECKFFAHYFFLLRYFFGGQKSNQKTHPEAARY